MKNILVLFGGKSVESEVSIITGLITVNALDGDKYRAIPVYVNGNGEWYYHECLKDIDELKNLNEKRLNRVCLLDGDHALYRLKNKKLKKLFDITAVINCTHGGDGENGALAGKINTAGIPLASPPVCPSAICMDKGVTKVALKGLKVKTLPYKIMTCGKVDFSGLEFGFPVIVKPVSGGSSIGVGTANDQKELKTALSTAFRYDEKVIVEPLLENFVEINCACYQDGDNGVVVSECERPIASGKALSFDDKYLSGNREYPANIPTRTANRIKALTKKIYNELGFRGIIRIDFFLVDGKIFVNEINSIPGSMAYYLFCSSTTEYGKLLDSLIKFACLEFERGQTLVKKIPRVILNSTGTKGAKRL